MMTRTQQLRHKMPKMVKRPQQGPRASTPTKKPAREGPSFSENAGVAALDGKQEARTPDKKVGKPGAPKKSVEEVADQHWSEFARADKHSLFFSEVSEVKRRLLIRWGNTARQQATSVKDPERRRVLESCTKRFQIMEECIKMHRAWVLRSGNTAKASAEFASGWDVLEAFAASAPAERIRSDFMQNFVLEFKVDCSFLIRRSLVVHSLGRPKSPTRRPSTPGKEIHTSQHPSTHLPIHSFTHGPVHPIHPLFTTLCGPLQTPTHPDGTEWWRSVTVMGHMCQSIGGDLGQ